MVKYSHAAERGVSIIIIVRNCGNYTKTHLRRCINYYFIGAGENICRMTY